MISASFSRSFYNNKKIIINLIGSANITNKCAEDIQYFANDYALQSIVTENNLYSLSRVLYYNSPNIIINPCGIISCDEISNLNYKMFIGSLSTYSSYNFLVESHMCDIDKEIKTNLVKCRHIHELYDLDTHNFYKKKLLDRYLLNIF